MGEVVRHHCPARVSCLAGGSIQCVTVLPVHRPTDGTPMEQRIFIIPSFCSPEWGHHGQVTVSLRQVFLRIDGRYTRSTGKASGTDPISQIDRMGRLPPTRSYAGGRS